VFWIQNRQILVRVPVGVLNSENLFAEDIEQFLDKIRFNHRGKLEDLLDICKDKN